MMTWDTPEAIEKKQQINQLVDQTIQRFRVVRGNGTIADRARLAGFGVELLVGVTDAFEIDKDFRQRVRTLSERWLAFQADIRELNRMFATVLMMLERLKLVVEAA